MTMMEKPGTSRNLVAPHTPVGSFEKRRHEVRIGENMSSALYWLQCKGCRGDSMSLLELESPDLLAEHNPVNQKLARSDTFDLIFMDIQMPENGHFKRSRQ